MTSRSVTLWGPLLLLLALVSGYVDARVRAHPEVAVTQYVPDVVSGVADAPGRYRVLAPFTVQAVSDLSGMSRTSAWYLTRLAWFLCAFAAFNAYLRTWVGPGSAMLGTSLLAAVLPITYTNSTAHPDHIPELALMSLACMAVVRGKDLLFGVALLVATLNRETAAFLVAFHFFARPLTRGHFWTTAGFGLLWLGVFAGLRLWRGAAAYDYWQFWRNIEFLGLLPPPYDPYYRAYAWFVVVLVACLGTVVATGWRTYPREVRAGIMTVPLVLLVGFTISSVIETRIFTPLLPFMLPAVVLSVAGADEPRGIRLGENAR